MVSVYLTLNEDGRPYYIPAEDIVRSLLPLLQSIQSGLYFVHTGKFQREGVGAASQSKAEVQSADI